MEGGASGISPATPKKRIWKNFKQKVKGDWKDFRNWKDFEMKIKEIGRISEPPHSWIMTHFNTVAQRRHGNEVIS